jgi:transposase
MLDMQRKKYSPEFKHEAVERVRRSQTSCRQIALEIGINSNMLTRWVREADGPADLHGGLAPHAIKNWLA